MYRKDLFFGIVAVLLCIGLLPVLGQNATQSPYSRYGYGRLLDNAYGTSRGMGGVAYGLRSNTQINPANPASYTSLDSTTFLFDFGLSAQLGSFRENGNKANKPTGNLDYMAMQFPISKYLGASIGLTPFSSTGYEFGTTSTDLGGYSEVKSGTGGFSQLYGGLSIRPIKNLSLGANLIYIFGENEHGSSLKFDDAGTNNYNKIERLKINGLRQEYGAQWTQPLNKKNVLTIGAVFSPSSNLKNMSQNVTMDGSGVVTHGDTIRNQKMSIPMSYGVGVSYEWDNRLKLAADFSLQQWSKALFKGAQGMLMIDEENQEQIPFRDRMRISLGAEYQPDYKGQYYYQRMKYRLGGYATQSYFDVKNNRINEWGAGIGVGLPFINSRIIRSVANISLDYVSVRPSGAQLVKEDYVRFTLNITFNEFWFFKRRLD